MQLDLVFVVGEPGPDGLRAVGRVPVDDQVDLVVEVPDDFQGRCGLINSALSRAVVDSIRVLSYAAPTEPMDAAMPAA
ncbi:hypothetical protein ACFY20_44650 [Streptomyces sp. NPDC001312]|uniref:hypothetical protein n=1 Tax=Streptomyces sp. NPDC001312 TaxID=3364561 RepID=UPI0036D1142C